MTRRNLLCGTALMLAASGPFPFAAAQLDLSCDVREDTCPTQFDGICDRDTNPECAGFDCFDCDECGAFDYDCEACTSNGCYWCPGDARCYNSDRYRSNNVFEECQDRSDFVQDTCTSPENVFTDPMYSGESWVYRMINVEEVWRGGIFGKGIHVRINDNGVDVDHPEFEGRYDIENSCDVFDSADFNRGGLSDSHGTAVASIVAAGANNGECSVGIAPEATISSCSIFDITTALGDKLENVDISQNSWGIDGCDPFAASRHLQEVTECPFTFEESSSFPCDTCDFGSIDDSCESAIINHCKSHYEDDILGCSEFTDLILGGFCYFGVLSLRYSNALTQGVVTGREGRGIVFIAASGNRFRDGDDTNFQGLTQSRFMISVGGVGKDRLHARYSTPGASLFISAPGGDLENKSNHVVGGVDGQCEDIGYGTSYSAPVVSGVVALMLEMNENLTYRDVQEILARTSNSVEDPDDTTAYTNAAGVWHSNFYGFGIVDAGRAVELAENFESIGAEEIVVGESGLLNLPIFDDENESITSTITVNETSPNFVIESVVVLLDVGYYSRGHLQVVLTSPQGTPSVLTPGQRPENTQLPGDERWKLMTVRSWGEKPDGEWTLSLVDNKEGDVGCVSGPWQITLGSSTINCNFLEKEDFCQDGQIDPDELLLDVQRDIIFTTAVDGQLASEACCACGGIGVSREDIVDELRQWRLVIYGHEQPEGLSEVPSASPSQPEGSVTIPGGGGSFSFPTSTRATESPSALPSTTPSFQPSMVPSVSLAPSISPSSSPSSQPSISPSHEPSLAPSRMPSMTPSVTPSQIPSVAPPRSPSRITSAPTVSSSTRIYHAGALVGVIAMATALLL